MQRDSLPPKKLQFKICMKKSLSLLIIVLIASEGLFAQQKGFLAGLFKSKKDEQPEYEVTLNQELLTFSPTFDANQYLQLDLDNFLMEVTPDDIHGDRLFVREYGVDVEIGQGLSIDSIWLAADPYYNIWDSRKVNPYDLDGEKFSDTLKIELFDCGHDLGWSMPIQNTHETSPFGLRRSRWHYGTDLRLRVGDPVVSAYDGIVRMAKYDRYGYGHYVLVRHYNGLETLYGHLSKRKVEVGQEVKAGELIGLGGNSGRSTGPHLHFEIRYQGNAIDPTSVYDFENDSLLSSTIEIKPETFSYLTEARKN